MILRMGRGAHRAFSLSSLFSAGRWLWALFRNHGFAIAIVLGVCQTVPRAMGQAPPVNDNFANAVQLSGSNVVVGGSNINATKEPGEPDHAGFSGGKSVWWKWQSPAAGYAKISTLGSIDSFFGGPLDTLLGVYAGTSVANLTEVASNDEGPVDSTSEVFFRTSAGTQYYIAVDGYAFDTPDTAASGTIHLSIAFSVSAPLAPAWGPLPSIDGGTLSSTNFDGQVVVLNFWATWCGPCVAEIPDLITLQNNYAAAGLNVVGISVDDSTDGFTPPLELVSSFSANEGMTYPVAMSRPLDYAIESAYGGIPYIPNTFIIDRHNHLIQTFVGTQSYSIFEGAVLPLLYAPPNLTLTISAGVAHISWPITQLTLWVESTDQPTSGAWTPVGATPQSDGVNQSIDVQIGVGNQFFRLHSQ